MHNISVNVSKFVLLVLGMVCVTLLMVTSTIEADAGMPILSGVVFYAIGNGVNSIRGQGTRSVLESKASVE